MLVPVVLTAETHKMHTYTGVVWRGVWEEQFNSQTNLQLTARQQQVQHPEGCDARQVGGWEESVSDALKRPFSKKKGGDGEMLTQPRNLLRKQLKNFKKSDDLSSTRAYYLRRQRAAGAIVRN